MLRTAARRGARSRYLALTALSVVVFITFQTGAAQAAGRDRYFDVRTNFADERVVGATSVHIAGMDPINTPWTVGVKGTASSPPDISFITSAATGGASLINATGATVRRGKKPVPVPTCGPNDPIDGNLSACIDAFAVNVKAADMTLHAAAKDEQGIQNRSRSLVANAPDLRSKLNYDAFKTQVRVCIFGDPPPAGITCPIAAPGQSAVDKPSTAKSVDIADAAYVTALTDFNRISGSQAFNAADAVAKGRLAAYKSALDADKTGLDVIDKFRHDTLDPLTLSQYFYESDASCGGVFNAGREKQITMTFGAADTRDVTIVCPTPVFVTIGLGHDGLSNHTFTAVAPNTAGQPAPAASATPAPSTILENDAGTRVVAQTMLHFALTSDDQGSGLAYSLGIGVPFYKGGGGTDLLTGLSYAYRRTAAVTAGIAFGKTQQLAPGYAAGGLIPNGQTPPTLNHYSSAFFFGVSFGK